MEIVNISFHTVAIAVLTAFGNVAFSLLVSHCKGFMFSL